ncbi:hypothetical protein WAB17_00050 [Parerythrobacter aurantius]|uniref:hypothetical protein n=1 Tax=Parerythrobacter aurantius TaxID=3127706 RepID=UPI00324594E2
MRRCWLFALALAGATWTAPAFASGDYCEPRWTPENAGFSCVSSVPIAPGNDTRVNLFLLLQDRAGRNGQGLAYPETEPFYGRNFLKWRDVANAWYPRPEAADSEGGAADDTGDEVGSGRCQTLGSGKRSFLAAVEQAAGVKPGERSLLASTRDRLGAVCENGPGSVRLPGEGGYFANFGANGIPDAPAGFMAYLEASASFYGGEWDRAKVYYRKVAGARANGWLTETATYMIARTLLNEAMDKSEDEWGWFDLQKADPSVARQSEDAFMEYLEAYPDGRYAASARGLVRKALWLQRDFARLGTAYGAALQTVDPAQEESARLVEEIDDKLLVRDRTPGAADPVLSATNLLMRMRPHSFDPDEKQLTREELDAEAATFAETPELWSFLEATHAFYVGKDYAAVLELLPDDARQESYAPLAFSRQYLRGLALHALNDRNEEGFWRQLVEGSDGLWQRPSVELALARSLEQKGELQDVFASGSPVREPRLRRILLGNSAGPAILKAQARTSDGPAGEASFATFVVLWRQLQRHEFAGFLADLPLAAKFEPGEDSYGLWNLLDTPVAPANVFVQGPTADGFACPSLERTARTLAGRPKDAAALLCLGDFLRLNGFDDFSLSSGWVEDDEGVELGTSAGYPGKAFVRHDYYTAVMDDPVATRDQQAYALYRAIRCYAPSRNNSCGGDGVEADVRAAWFKRLKARYSDTRWAREAKYYW